MTLKKIQKIKKCIELYQAKLDKLKKMYTFKTHNALYEQTKKILEQISKAPKIDQGKSKVLSGTIVQWDGGGLTILQKMFVVVVLVVLMLMVMYLNQIINQQKQHMDID